MKNKIITAYNNEWFDFVPTTSSKINIIEEKLNIHFSEKLRKLFLSCNGAYPKLNTYYSEHEVSLGNLLPFDVKKTDKRRSFDLIYRELVIENKIIPKHLIPFAFDTGNANFFCIDLNTEFVIYWLHDDTDAEIFISEDLEEFLFNLEEEP